MSKLDPERDERFTPGKLFNPLNWLFSFTLDPCTTEDNPLCLLHFYTKERDGLSRSWLGERVFVNPPYSAMLDWAAKAVMEAQAGCFVAFLLPNDCSTKAYKLLAENAWACWRVPFRVKFGTPTAGEVKDVARSHVVFLLGGLPR